MPSSSERNLGVERYRQWLVGTILAALAGSATLAYALFTRTQAQVSALAQTRRLLQLQNEELEVLVRERTAETEEARAHAERERERVETLLQDTNHRIGNSLATVSSLLGLQMSRSKSDEVKHALEAAQNRVHAIASSSPAAPARRRPRDRADAAEFLEAVLADLQATQSGAEGVEFVAQCDPVVIKARDATTIGIIAGELVTNALKHAFPDGKGHIWVRFARTDGVITLTVEDDGKGLDADGGPGDGGLGSMIIRQLAHAVRRQAALCRPRWRWDCGHGAAPDLSPPKD